MRSLVGTPEPFDITGIKVRSLKGMQTLVRYAKDLHHLHQLSLILPNPEEMLAHGGEGLCNDDMPNRY